MSQKSRELGINEVEDFAPHLRPVLEEAVENMEFLNQLTKDDAAKLPEPIFVEHLLPVLANREGNQGLQRWQEIAGHVMRPIDVVDPKNGEVLFRVPPILRSINEEFTGRGASSAFEIVRVAEQKRKVIPAMGDAHIRANLVERVRHIPAHADSVIRWNEILKRYGYPPILKMDTSENDVKEDGESVSSDIEIDGYDDF